MVALLPSLGRGACFAPLNAYRFPIDTVREREIGGFCEGFTGR